jgi:hypothetical protein
MIQSNSYKADAFWLSPDKEIFPVSRHISFMSENLEMFGLSREQYNAYFDKYKEPYGFEGKARDELMQVAFERGWIRLRNYINKGWICELWVMDKHSKTNLRSWVKKYFFAELNLVGYHLAKIEVHEISKYIEGMKESEWKSYIKIKL